MTKLVEFNIDFLNFYLEKTSSRLSIEDQRYGGGFFAIATNGFYADMLFDMLSGADLEAISTQFFLWNNSILPVAFGRTVKETIQHLNQKLEVLFIKDKDNYLDPKFKLKALADSDNEEVVFNNVTYDMIFDDVYLFLKEQKNKCIQKGEEPYTSSWYWYETMLEKCSKTEYRYFHALVNYKYPEDLEQVLASIENMLIIGEKKD